MADAQVIGLLKSLGSSTNAERQQAEGLYAQTKVANPEQIIVSLVGVLGAAGQEEAVRRQAAVLLRQLVNSNGSEKDYAFAKLTPDKKALVGQELLKLFEAEQNAPQQKKIGEIISKVAEGAYDKADQRGWVNNGQPGWPMVLELSFRMANPASNPNGASCESALRLLKELVITLKEEVVKAQAQLGQVLQNAFQHADVKVKCAGVLLVCEIVGAVDKKSYAPLLATVPVMNQVLQQMAQSNMQTELEECLQAYTEVAGEEPDFFKQSIQQSMEPATFMSLLVKQREGIEEGIRSLALEWLVSYVEKKPKWLSKSVPAMPALAMECCMEMMLEVEDGAEELKQWAERMDDEEGEEDADEIFHTGEEAIDRVVEAIGMESCAQALFAVVGKNATIDAWQARHAALATLKQTVEYIEETEHMNQCAQLLLTHMEHPHPRVRYMALHALGQLANDQAPQFQEAWHKTVMPILLKMMEDPVDRVASMAMSAFVSFGSEIDGTLMLEYSSVFMEKLVQRLQNSKHRMVLEESITSIAVIAGCIEKDFSKYYDGMMPLLKQFVMTATDPKQNRLRGKAFECMSLLGLAVGKEKFLPDAREALSAMLQMPAEADDLQKEYIKEASERICKCLKADFAAFLPAMLPGLFAALKIDAEEASGKIGDDDDDDYVTVSTGDGKLKKVRTSKFEEMLQAVQLMTTFATEMEGAFFDYVPKAAESLLPLLSTDEIVLLCDEARTAAYSCWAILIKSAIQGAKDRGQPANIARELLQTFLQKIFVILQQEIDPDTVREASEGIAACLKNADPGMLNEQEVLQIVQKLFALIDESLNRSAALQNDRIQSQVGAPAELLADEDDEDTPEEDEETCRRCAEEALGACMKVSPAEFVKCLPEVSGRMQLWLSNKKQRTLGLFLACDLLEHLKEHSQSVWPIFMPVLFQSLVDSDPEVRIPAAYAINLASPIAAFAEAAPQAFRGLAQIVGGPAPKKRDEKAKVAFDNAVAALLGLAKNKAAQCPPEIQAFQLVVAKLPLKDDEEEARKVHKLVCDMVLGQHEGLLGAGAAHLGKIMSALAEIHKSETLSEKETDEKITQIFKSLPQDRLMQLAANFTEKQQKKIEKLLTS